MSGLFERMRHISLSENYDDAVDPEAYDHHVRTIHKRHHLAKRLVHDIFIRKVTPYKEDATSSKVLDIAAGTGIISRSLANAGYEVTATDLSTKALSYLETKDPRIQTTPADMNEPLPFKSATFDGVTTVWGNRFIEDTEAFTSEVHRVLKSGGVFVWPIFVAEAPLWKAKQGVTTPTLPPHLAAQLRDYGFGSVTIEPADTLSYLVKDKMLPHTIPTYIIGIKGENTVRQPVTNTIFHRAAPLAQAL